MEQSKETERIQIAIALLRITLGLIILATWFDNLAKGLYSADGLTNFLNWLADPNGNAGSLTLYHGLLETTVVPIAGLFGSFQMVAEFAIGLGLLLGGMTRVWGVAAMIFVLNLFLAYFGGHEWIWTYVLLFISAVTVTLGAAGRKWGLDRWIRQYNKSSPLVLLT